MLAKIFFALTLVGLAVAGYAGYTLVGKINVQEAAIAKKNTDIANTDSAIQTLDNKIADQKAELVKLDEKKKDLAAKITVATDKLAEAKRKADSLEAKVKEASDKANLAEKDFKDKTDKFGEIKPEQFRAEIAKLEEELKIANSEGTVLTAKNKELVDEAERLRKATAIAATGGVIPGVSGKVTDVNRKWNYVTLNMGTHDGIAPNGVLHVYRGRTFVGKLRVISVEGHTATANVLTEESSREIQPGDQIMN